MKYENKIGVFAIGTIKAFRGHEGETCLQGTILKDGKKVATWSEDAWGGPHQFHFASKKDHEEFNVAANQHPIALEFVKEFEEEYKLPISHDNHADLVVSKIAQDIDLERRQLAQVKRWCASKTVLKEKASEEGVYVVFKIAYSPEKDAELLKRYPGAEIVNKRFL